MPIHPNFPFPLYLVISEEACIHQPWLQVAEEAIYGGVDIIQLREKDMSYDQFLDHAKQLKALCDKHAVPLIINDQVEIAKEVASWGIHVGQSDTSPIEIREKLGDSIQIGWSLEVLDQLDDSQIQAVNHLGVSPIYQTKTKTNTITEWGLDGLQQIRQLTNLPLIAIGNMNMDTAAATYNAGADSIAVVSAICSSPNPRSAAESLKALLI
ncbi:thiamine phosphate synthase [Sphingobacterium kyonggiense]|uniref:Thiamine-phosphate synthase n=1 Tax=Sphingobacterium kyonggiense TaxID=714075 RepID=A0ABP7YLG7_9SPHI